MIRDTLLTIALQVAMAAAIALILVLGERLFALPLAIRQFGGGVLIVVGSLLMSSGSGQALFDKGAIRGIGAKDIEEYKATRAGNVSAGVRLFIIGVVLFGSLFVL